MYRMIIADDEFLARNGLIKCVDWNVLGFEIVEQFEDGEDVIAYIDKNPVDVIFTDVQMFCASGLEVAQWVSTNQPSVKVVFVSGYKDFDYIKRAMELSVCNYVLKPINVDEIIRIFTKIKKELDETNKKGGASVYPIGITTESNGIASSDEYIVERARAYVDQHLGEDFGLDNVADCLYLSKSHFSREIKRLTGDSFMRYVMQRRMEKAMELIRSGINSTSKIANCVGYNDVKYFQKCFKKYAGCSIREYQRLVHSQEDQ